MTNASPSESHTAEKAQAERARFESQLHTWRSDLLQRILLAALVVIALALLICIWQVSMGRLAASNAEATGLAFAIIASAVLAPKQWQRYRIGSLLLVTYFAGAIGSLGGIVSLYGAGFVGFVAMSALFSDGRGAIMALGLVIVHTLAVALLHQQGWFSSLIPDEGLDPTSPVNWIRAMCFLLAIAVMVSRCIVSLLNRLRDNLLKSLELIDKLESERDQRADLQEQMRRSERMEALGRLAGGIAHDFNNTLTIMGSEADYIVAEVGENHPIGESAEIIRQATERAANLTRRLLLLGRHKEFLHPVPVNLVTVINDFVRVSRRVLPESIEFAFDRCEPSVVKVDESALHQVLLNLAINAGDAMEHEGRITLSCGEREVKNGESMLPAGRYGYIQVADTGTGIDSEDLKGIFDPFYTTKESKRGSGMSLATSYGFAAASGGSIEAQSELGVGTTFTLLLPHTDERVHDAVAHLDSISSLGKGRLALLAEDNLRVRAIMWSALVDAGFEVLEASDGQAAHQLAIECARPISVLVTDFMMPKMDGITLAERCHEKNPDMKIVVVTGYATSGASERLRELPHTLLLPKPFGRRDLYRALENLG